MQQRQKDNTLSTVQDEQRVSHDELNYKEVYLHNDAAGERRKTCEVSICHLVIFNLQLKQSICQYSIRGEENLNE